MCGNVHGPLHGHLESSVESVRTTVTKGKKSDRIVHQTLNCETNSTLYKTIL